MDTIPNRKRRMTRMKRYRKQKKKKRLIFFTIFSFLIITIGIFFAKSVYAKNQCKDLSKAVDYYMTSNIDNSLLRVQNMDLLFLDGKTAIIEASGLSKEEPHASKKVKCRFEMVDNIWRLDESYPLENTY